MDTERFERLQRVQIANPCPENWDAMSGDAQKRFCEKCTKHVHNLAEMSAEEAEQTLTTDQKICCRITIHERLGVLTRDGWIPRMLLAGGVAATMAGCTSNNVDHQAEIARKEAQEQSAQAMDNWMTDFVETVREKVLHEKKEVVFMGWVPARSAISPAPSTLTTRHSK